MKIGRLLDPAVSAVLLAALCVSLHGHSAADANPSLPSAGAPFRHTVPVHTLPGNSALYRMAPWSARKLYHGPRYNLGVTASGVINNVVVIVMENRTVDNLFAGYYDSYYGHTGELWQNVVQVENPRVPPLRQISLASSGDPNHHHEVGFRKECGYGDGACTYPWHDAVTCKGFDNCAVRPKSYINPQETAIYANLMYKYAFADGVYQANQGPSFAAHQYLIAGQSGGLTDSNHLSMAENTVGAGSLDPDDPTPPDISYNDPLPYIDAASGPLCGGSARTHLLDMSDSYLSAMIEERYINGPPCENYTTIFDRLQMLSPSFFAWEYHAHDDNGVWAAPMAIRHFANYHDTGHPIQNFVVDGDAIAYLKSEVPTGNVPAVTYLTPCPADSDHPNSMSVNGPNWVATILNTIGANTNLWNHTAVFIVWDDWGGWYDHEKIVFSPHNEYPWRGGAPPNPKDPMEWGFRVPLIVVSPYAKHGYVDHLPRSYSAILNFIEWNWGAPSLNADDAADSAANGGSGDSDNLSRLFDFTERPARWKHIDTGAYSPQPCPTPTPTPL